MRSRNSILLLSKQVFGKRFRSTAALSITDDLEKYDDTEASVYPKSYSEIPGPKELPFIGNAWRFAPFIGWYKFISIFISY